MASSIELRSRILSLMPHATISAFGDGLAGLAVRWRSAVARIPKCSRVAPYIEEQALLIADGETAGVAVTGILPAQERGVSELAAEDAPEGSFEALRAGQYGIVLGRELAKKLQVKVGERVVMATSQPVVTPAGVMARMRGFKVVGTFASGMYEFDRNFAYVHIGGCREAVSHGRQGHRLAFEARRHFCRAATRSRGRAVAGRRLLRERLDEQERELLSTTFSSRNRCSSSFC